MNFHSGFFYDYYYMILVVPAMFLALWAQYKVRSTYRKYSRISNTKRITGAQAAQIVLSNYGINDVAVECISGELTDHYDPKAKVIRLSENVYSNSSIAAIGVACHEAGHAAQHAEAYLPIKIRNLIIPVCNIGSMLGIPLALVGYFFGFQPLISIGLLLYAAIALFHVATLPVELNASHRAMRVISDNNLLLDDEQAGARKVLTAAAMTYIASMIVALANLLRLFLRLNRNSR